MPAPFPSRAVRARRLARRRRDPGRARRRRTILVIAVEDDGPGIPPHALERIFERFYTDRPKPGFGQNSGLGLSISRQIVEAHGGRIWAENRPATAAAPRAGADGAGAGRRADGGMAPARASSSNCRPSRHDARVDPAAAGGRRSRHRRCRRRSGRPDPRTVGLGQERAGPGADRPGARRRTPRARSATIASGCAPVRRPALAGGAAHMAGLIERRGDGIVQTVQRSRAAVVRLVVDLLPRGATGRDRLPRRRRSATAPSKASKRRACPSTGGSARPIKRMRRWSGLRSMTKGYAPDYGFRLNNSPQCTKMANSPPPRRRGGSGTGQPQAG